MNAELTTAFKAILPEFCLFVLAVLVLVLDLTLKEKRRLGWVVVFGVLLTVILAIAFSVPRGEPVSIWGGMLRADGAAFLFQLIFLFGAGLTALFSIGNDRLNLNGEYYTLLLVSSLGMCLMAASGDLIMLYLAIETTTIPLFVLAGFYIRDERSVESGLKYMLYSAMTSAVMLYGFSLLYGFSGTTNLYTLTQKMAGGQVPGVAILAGLMLSLVGFGFKVSAVPFHFWAPDVYEGAPTPVAGFLSTASKAAGFAVLIRFLFVAFPNLSGSWSIIVSLLAAASMIVGNTVALTQRNIKRLLAYSSIAQAGYILIGVAARSTFGSGAAIYYLLAYLVTNLAAFGIVMVVGQSIGSDDLSAYAGLSRRSPALAFLMLAAFLSLGGIPPFAGFVGKFLVFASAVQTNLIWLALVGVINSVVALYYYLNVLKVIYLHLPEQNCPPVRVNLAWVIALGMCAVGILILGVWVNPWLDFATRVAFSF
jgi:NADH-quinone oxidoreductase subunit N